MTADIRGILNGAVPAPTKKEQQLAAKRQRDRKRYAVKANQPWKTNVDQKPLSASATLPPNNFNSLPYGRLKQHRSHDTNNNGGF